MTRKYTDQQFIDAVQKNFSIRSVLKDLGLVPAGGSYKLFHARVKKLNLDTSHFTGKAYLKDKHFSQKPKIPMEEILVKGSTYLVTSHLRKRLIKENLLEDKCSQCNLTTWQSQKLSLHLDHINGDNTNNEIDNLRLLCPNCHSLTPTYCGRNKGKW